MNLSSAPLAQQNQPGRSGTVARHWTTHLKQAVARVSACFGMVKLTPEQQARIAAMERDYEQSRGLQFKRGSENNP